MKRRHSPTAVQGFLPAAVFVSIFQDLVGIIKVDIILLIQSEDVALLQYYKKNRNVF